MMHLEFGCSPCLCLDRPLLGLERQFHQFFYSGITELKLTDLTGLRQRNDESVAAFIQRFRDVKN